MSDRLESLISAAARQSSAEAYAAVLAGVPGTELYASVCRPWSPGGPVRLETYPAGPLRKVLRFFTGQKHAGLSPSYAGMRWESIIDMISRSPALDGVQLVNHADDWVLFGRGELLVRDAQLLTPLATRHAS